MGRLGRVTDTGRETHAHVPNTLVDGVSVARVLSLSLAYLAAGVHPTFTLSRVH